MRTQSRPAESYADLSARLDASQSIVQSAAAQALRRAEDRPNEPGAHRTGRHVERHSRADAKDAEEVADIAEDRPASWHEHVPTRFDPLQDLVLRLERIEQLLTGSNAYANLAARIEASQSLISGETGEAIRQEIHQLDGYIAYHHDQLLARVTAIVRQSPCYSSPAVDAICHANGHEIVVPTVEVSLIAHISRHAFEQLGADATAIINARVKSGAAVVDVGSNIGRHALTLAANVGPSGTMHCFEPAPHMAAALERTLRLNGFSDIGHVHREAVTDHTGQATFHRAHHGPMSSIFALPGFMTAEEIQVPATTLDCRIPPGGRVDFINIDAAGAEPNVWRGMGRIIADNPQLEIALEWSCSHFQRSGGDPAQFMQDIRAAGFKPYLVDSRPKRPLMQSLGDEAGALEGATLLLTRGDL